MQAAVINRDAVFSSVGQALFVSFLMEVLPPTQKGATELVIDELKRRHFNLEAKSDNERTLNMRGLSPLELRGQCAMVRAVVQDHLPQPERVAIWSRYGHQRTKAEGVRGITEYLRGLYSMPHGEAVLAITWAIYVPRNTPRDRSTGRKEDWSLRTLAERYRVDRRVLAENQRQIRHHAQQLERAGEQRLSGLFDRTGLVGEISSDVAVSG